MSQGDRSVGREASERRSGIGEDDRQLVMARLTTWCKHSNLVILVSLKKGNYPSEAYVRRGQRKAYTEEKGGLLRGAP